MKPSQEQINVFQELYTIFNNQLFSGKLPDVILNFSRSGSKTIAFFRPKTWICLKEGSKILPEISLSPRYLYRDRREVFSSIVHEQCHLWQDKFGKPPRACYHDLQWANKMIEVGLQPDNGHGGSTGQSVSHKIINGGAFDKIFKTLNEDLHLPFLTTKDDDGEKKKNTSRKKYTCPKCETSVWGKPNLSINCGGCNAQYEEQ